MTIADKIKGLFCSEPDEDEILRQCNVFDSQIKCGMKDEEVYLGGSSVPVNIAPVAQTSASAISGSATPQGNLSAIGTLLSKSGFTQSFTEHGVIIGLANVQIGRASCRERVLRLV